MKQLNNKGSIFILSYIVMFGLITLSVGIALLNINELNYARRHRHEATAFWLAEAGVNMFLKDQDILNEQNPLVITEADREIRILKDDSNPINRVVTSTGRFAGMKKSIEIKYSAQIPDVFLTTVSAGGDIEIAGEKAKVVFNDKTRISGHVKNTSNFSNVFFEDKKENEDPGLISLHYPDADKNGEADEFSDFVAFNRKLISKYRDNEVIYIQGDDTYTITPQSRLNGKKIIFIDGKEGQGDVIVQFNGILQKNQDLTVISTGTVTFNQAGAMAPNAQLNIISWGGYNETAILPARHAGFIFTHGKAVFDDIYDTSVTQGGLVANEGVWIGEVWSNKTFSYKDSRTEGVLPVGFGGLIGGGSSGYSALPNSWRAI